MGNLLGRRMRVAIHRDRLCTETLQLDDDFFAEFSGTQQHHPDRIRRQRRADAHLTMPRRRRKGGRRNMAAPGSAHAARQFFALSTSLFLAIHGIIARRRSPTSSIGWAACFARVALKEGWPALFSRTQSRANFPF